MGKVLLIIIIVLLIAGACVGYFYMNNQTKESNKSSYIQGLRDGQNETKAYEIGFKIGTATTITTIINQIGNCEPLVLTFEDVSTTIIKKDCSIRQ